MKINILILFIYAKVLNFFMKLKFLQFKIENILKFYYFLL